VLNWGLNAQQAINLPDFGSPGGPSLLEEKRFSPATADALKARGAEVREQAMTNGLHAIQKTLDGFFLMAPIPNVKALCAGIDNKKWRCGNKYGGVKL
jgi:gamma-glutamyltranspeptidase